MNIYSDIYQIRKSWKSVHKDQADFFDIWKLLWSSNLIRYNLIRSEQKKFPIDVIVFSITPQLVYIAESLLSKQIDTELIRFVVVDCCGNIKTINAKTRKFRLINYVHWYKMDIALNRLSTSDITMFCDDDVFILDEFAIKFVLQEIQNHAAVSLVPRQRFTWEIGGKEFQPMGTYCLAVNRPLWQKENLSFKTRKSKSPSAKSLNGEFDTGDYANIKLIEKGNKISIADEDFRNKHLMVFKGISRGIRQIREDPLYLKTNKNHTYLYRIARFLLELSNLLEGLDNLPCSSSIIDRKILNRYLDKAGANIEGLKRVDIDLKLKNQMQTLTQAL